MTWIFTIVAFLLFGMADIQNIPSDISTDPAVDIETIDRYEGADGFYIFMPKEHDGPLNLVTFVHGFGALNPVVYGGWIEHLTSTGNVVVYARYQESMFSTPTTEFVPNTIAAIKEARKALDEKDVEYTRDHIDLIGHSYGGVIIGNIAANYQDFELPFPRVVFLCEPGSGPLTGGVLESYESIPSESLLAIVVGDDDRTVGQSLGKKVFETALRTPNRVLFWQYADENGDENIGASHYEPYSYNDKFDNGIDNFTVKRAGKVSNLDAVDHFGYWQIFDTLKECSVSGQDRLDMTTIDVMADLGSWSDGTPIRAMEVFVAED